MRVIITAAILAAAWFSPALAKSHQLWLLPHGYLRIDHGPVFGRRALSFELRKLKHGGECPPIHIHLRRDSKYDEVSSILLEFNKSGCDNIGFTGEEGPN